MTIKICATLDKLEYSLKKTSSFERFDQLATQVKKLTPSRKKNELKARMVAFQYRRGDLKPNSQTDSSIEAKILAEAVNWKKRQICFKTASLSTREIKRIQEACQYRAFAKLLNKDPNLRLRFFKWTLQNGHKVPIFVQYPALSQSIRTCLLEGRLSRTHSLKYNRTNKDVLIRTEKGKLFSLLNPSNRIDLHKGDSVTVKEVFEIFKQKNTKEGRLTFKGKGLSNWDPHRFGRRNGKTGKLEPIDFENPEWFKQIKPERIVSKERAAEIFGVPCDGKKWVVSVAATRQVKGKLTMTGSHSFLRFAFPDSEGNYHCCYPISKFPKKYPKNMFETIGKLFGYTYGTLELPDNNYFYTHREKKEMHFLNSSKRSLKLMDSIRKDLVAAQNNNLPFQYMIDNCTHWVTGKVEKFVYKDIKQHFSEDFLEIKAAGFLGGLIKVTKILPTFLQSSFLFAFCLAFGGGRTKTYVVNGKKRRYSLLKNAPWKGKQFTHPGLFFK